jgi:DNA ligase (NAD+)
MNMNRSTFAQTAADLRTAAKAYYDTDVETMTDATYDQGIETLRIAVAENPSWATDVTDLLTLVAAGQSSGGDVEHTSLMGSMDKANTLDAVTAFMTKITGPVVVEPKMDGLAVAQD